MSVDVKVSKMGKWQILTHFFFRKISRPDLKLIQLKKVHLKIKLFLFCKKKKKEGGECALVFFLNILNKFIAKLHSCPVF